MVNDLFIFYNWKFYLVGVVVIFRVKYFMVIIYGWYDKTRDVISKKKIIYGFIKMIVRSVYGICV